VARDLSRLGPQAMLSEVRKDDDDARREIERRLEQLLRAFGMQQLGEAAGGAARSAGGKWLVRPTLIEEFMRAKDVRLQQILSETREQVRASVRDIIADALAEERTPSAGAIARRIRNTFHGKEGVGGEVMRVGHDSGIVLPTARYSTEDGTLYAFSSERAALIARTELVQAENTGIVEGYRAAGVEMIEWVAYSDGLSGRRRHDEMDGVRARVGELFATPLGNRLRYPGDPEAPIEETANCRCTVVAVVA
jgi:hypothetical protein